MKQEYNRLFDKIESGMSDEIFVEETLRKAETLQRRKRIRKTSFIVPAAAAAVLAIGTIGVGAAYGFSHLSDLFGSRENLSSEIQSNVYEDSDGHVKVTIEQLLSDGRRIHAAVHYEALDETGTQWLAEKEFAQDHLASSETINIKASVTGMECGMNEWGSIELDEQRTETDRYFYVLGGLHETIWDAPDLKGTFTYPMPDGQRSAEVDIGGTMDVRTYTIEGEEACSHFVQPTCLQISDLSYTLYARSLTPLTERIDHEDGGYTIQTTLTSEEQDGLFGTETKLVFSDGTMLPLEPLYSETVEPDEANGGADLIWKAGEIFNTEAPNNCWEHDYNVAFSLDDLTGIEIGGVYYELTAK